MLRWIGIGVVTLLLLAQLVPIDRTNPRVEGDVKAPPDIGRSLRAACYDCHSNETVWPWYSHVAPISWLVSRDVQQARRHLNLSHWEDYSAEERVRLLSEIGSAVRNGEMPVPRYLWLHPEARLTDAERQQIYRWTRTERSRVGPPPLRAGLDLADH